MAKSSLKARQSARPKPRKGTVRAVTFKPVYVLNGPNLNLLGEREPHIYGTATLAAVKTMMAEAALPLGLKTVFRQSNHEGELIDWVQEARTKASGVIINAAAYSHSSIALHDALAALDIPILEVHITNVFKREAFRHHSYISLVATGVICGLGVEGYALALHAIHRQIST